MPDFFQIHPARARRGFTLLEVLTAMAILSMAFAIIWTTYSAAVNGWQRGRALLDQLHQGDVVIEQLVGALRSAAYFSNRPEKYGFRLETHGSGSDSADEISWVTSGTTFLPPDSPLAAGLHRLVFTLDFDDEGRRAVAVTAYPHLVDEEEFSEPDPWFVSTDEIQGFRCRVYDAEEEDWKHEWENTNSVPRLLELTFYLKPIKEYSEPQVLKRLVEIPIAPPLGEAAAPAAEPAAGEQPATGGSSGGTTNAPAGTGSGGRRPESGDGEDRSGDRRSSEDGTRIEVREP